jgi:hypothetical protein
VQEDSGKSPRHTDLLYTKKSLIRKLEEESAFDLSLPLDACGQPFLLTCTCCGTQKETTTSCNKRWCPVCAPVLTAQRLAKWSHAIDRLQWPLFVTFTIPNSEDPETLRDLKNHWAKFRRRKIFKDQVKGGVATFEVTNKGRGWHPHIHALLDCEWFSIFVPPPRPNDTAAVKKEKCELAQQELSRAWADQIQSPHGIVWPRRVYGLGVVKEVFKYAVKGSDLLECPDPIAPMLRVLAKTRTLSGFGCLHPLPSPDEEEPFAVTCEGCGEEKTFMPDELVSFIGKSGLPGPQGRTLPPSKQAATP